MQIRRIYLLNSVFGSIWSHLTNCRVLLTSILPWIGFGINKWKENCVLTPPWKEIWSQSVWICIFLVSWSSFFFPHLIYSAREWCQQNLSPRKASLKPFKTLSVASHPCRLLSQRQNRHFFHLSSSHLWFWSENKAQTQYLEAQWDPMCSSR